MIIFYHCINTLFLNCLDEIRNGDKNNFFIVKRSVEIFSIQFVSERISSIICSKDLFYILNLCLVYFNRISFHFKIYLFFSDAK